MTKNKLELRKEELYRIIFTTDTPAALRFDVYLLYVILFSVVVALLDSVDYLHDRFRLLFVISEWIITAVFTVEYIVRIYVSPLKRKYIFSFYGMIDLLAILPSFVGLFVQGSNFLVVIRAIRLLRIFRILKLTHYIKESSHLMVAIQRSLNKIVIFITFIVILVVILGSVMYMVEAPFNHSFSNIPKSIYWAIVTITTVGYGDITPVTFLGQFISAIVMLLGYAFIAVPTGIFSSELIRQMKGKNVECPNCHNRDHDRDARFCKECGTQLPNG